jgi:probable phosphoglycerate mutase
MAPRSIDLGNPFIASLDGVCELLLVRHGEQHFQPDKPLDLNVDAPLSELGRRQAESVGQRLADLHLDAVYASTMQRALHTGQAIAGHHDIEVVPRNDLIEINLWAALDQSRTLIDAVGADELRRIYRAAAEARSWDAYPHVEDTAAFRTRVRAGIDAILAGHEGQRIALACHGGVINAYLAGLFDSPHDNVVSVHHTSITTVRAAGERRAVVAVNDYAHVLPFQSKLDPLNAA